MNSLDKIFLPLLHPQYVLQPSTNAPGLLLHAAHGLALPLLAGAQHPITDLEEVIRAHWAHRTPVPVWAVAVGPVMGLQQDLKPADARDLSTCEQHQMEVSKSFLQMRPVEVRMMSWTLLTRQTYHKGVCLCLTSPLQMMKTLANKKHMNMLIRVTLTLWHVETNSSVRG